MRIIMQGLEFETQTPSAYRLVSVRDDLNSGDRVHVVFTGEQWGIAYYPAGRSLPIFRPFASRDEAVALIASRRP